MEYVRPQEVRRIDFTAQRVNDFLGTDISEENMISILATLGFTTEKHDKVLTAVVPTWRIDCTEMPDIAEEVARIYGYENIQSTRLSVIFRKARKDLNMPFGNIFRPS